jgi:hypothetical protein
LLSSAHWCSWQTAQMHDHRQAIKRTFAIYRLYSDKPMGMPRAKCDDIDHR